MLERLLRRDRLVTAAGLAALCGLSWVYLLMGAGFGTNALDLTTASLFPHKAALGSTPMPMAMDSGMAGMTGMVMPADRSRAWSIEFWCLTVTMWWVMMVAMMIPSAAPTMLLYGRVHRHAAIRQQDAGIAPTWAFALGYLLVWLAFSLAAAGLHWALERSELVSASSMGSQSKWLSAALLATAGLYQLSPLQRICLSHCRSPAAFLSRHWQPGVLGAVRVGAMHGAYCVGCCWLLMALLFVGGAMNLIWVAALALLIMAEKLLPGGRRVTVAGGLVLLIWSGATLLT